MAYSILQAAAAVTGVLCLYCAFFLFEDEAGRVHDRVEQLWIRVGNRRAHELGRTTVFLNVLAEAASSGLDVLFGRRLVSLRSFGVAGSYSLFGLWIGWSLLAESSGKKLVGVQVGLALLALFCGSAPAWFKVPSATAIAFCPLLAVPFVVVAVSRFAPVQSLFVMSALVATLFVDFALIVFARILLRRMSASRHWFVVVLMALFQVFLAVLLFSAPIIGDVFQGSKAMEAFTDTVTEILTYLDFSTELVLLIFITLVPLLLWHALWRPVSRKAVDRIDGYSIAHRPMLVGTLGIACILVSLFAKILAT